MLFQIGLDITGLQLSEASLRFVEALRLAADLEDCVQTEPVEGGGYRFTTLSEEEVDAAFDKILTDIEALPDSADKVIAITRHGFLWSKVTLRYVRGRYKTTSRADIDAVLQDAQIGACWACGDGHLV